MPLCFPNVFEIPTAQVSPRLSAFLSALCQFLRRQMTRSVVCATLRLPAKRMVSLCRLRAISVGWRHDLVLPAFSTSTFGDTLIINLASSQIIHYRYQSVHEFSRKFRSPSENPSFQTSLLASGSYLTTLCPGDDQLSAHRVLVNFALRITRSAILFRSYLRDFHAQDMSCMRPICEVGALGGATQLVYAMQLASGCEIPKHIVVPDITTLKWRSRFLDHQTFHGLLMFWSDYSLSSLTNVRLEDVHVHNDTWESDVELRFR